MATRTNNITKNTSQWRKKSKNVKLKLMSQQLYRPQVCYFCCFSSRSRFRNFSLHISFITFNHHSLIILKLNTFLYGIKYSLFTLFAFLISSFSTTSKSVSSLLSFWKQLYIFFRMFRIFLPQSSKTDL